jgi:hypothetical protein
MSYSHADDDKLAPAVQSALHRFAKPRYRLRVIHVFRDKTSLSVTPALWPSIEKALSKSDYFLLLASPEGAASQWVRRELDFWVKERSPDKLLNILTGGEAAWDNSSRDFDWSCTNAIPGNFRCFFGQEPLYLDLRWAKSEEHLSLSHPRFRDAIADLAATLHGSPKINWSARKCGNIAEPSD